MMEKYNIKPQAWNTIKSRLSLVKDSNVHSPYTLENSTPEQVEAMIEKAIETHIDTKKSKYVNTYTKQWNAEAVKSMKIVSNFKYQLEMIEEAIERHQSMELDFVPKEQVNGKESHFILTDIHIGKNDTA